MAADSTSEAPALSVVVPVHDEAENVLPLLEEIRGILSGRRFEIVVVDDGSSDGTPERLARAAERTAELRVVRHGRRRGQSAALRSGVRSARAPWIVTLDGDGQNDPADIPALLRAAGVPGQEAPEPAVPPPRVLAIGERRERRDGWVRGAASRVAAWARRLALGDRTPDIGCGLKVFPRGLFLELPYFDHVHRFLPVLVRAADGRVVSVPVGHRERRHGRSHYGILDRLGVGLVDLAGVAWLVRRQAGGECGEEDRAG